MFLYNPRLTILFLITFITLVQSRDVNIIHSQKELVESRISYFIEKDIALADSKQFFCNK